LRRGEGRGTQLMSKTGYVEIASRLVTVARSCFKDFLNHVQIIFVFFFNYEVKYHKFHNHFSKEKAELKANLEAEALSFCWKWKRK
jgi:hypothetical protein